VIKIPGIVLAAVMGSFGVCFFSEAAALEINQIEIEGTLAGVVQYQNVSRAPDADDKTRGAVVFQPAVGVHLSERDFLYAKFGFASGNALNASQAFVQTPWAADLEQDVRGINGRDRDTLLTVWYRHTFDLSTFGSAALSGGIIDASEYLDQNAYANDEYTQFMNSALVNAPNAFLPSYDKGAAAEWENGAWSAAAVYMGLGGSDEAPSFHFLGAQVGCRLRLGIGEGGYRLIVNGTSDSFDTPQGDSRHRLYAIVISADQQIGDFLGAWIRIGQQGDKAEIDYQNLLSGGIHINGGLWARGQDNIGIGLAHMNGGNAGIDRGTVFEFYYRWVINDIAALTLDFQYMMDDWVDTSDPRGWIGGLRLVTSF
jgi:hypothetical protein